MADPVENRDVADKFPNAQVIGTDLSPVQPGMQPPNCEFEVDDCTSAWVYPDDHFDFVHIRGLFGSIGDWPALYGDIFKHTKPGGYLEQVEFSVVNRSQDDRLAGNSTLQRWSHYGMEIGKRTGKAFNVAETMAGAIEAAGFVHVVEKRFKWPVGPWSSDARMKEIGRWNLLNWEQGMEGWALASYTRVLGVSVFFFFSASPALTIGSMLTP